MQLIDDFFNAINEKDANGTLTVGEALIGRYYRLRNGNHAGRVIIKTSAMIDGESICYFANGLIHIKTSKISDILCESVCPTFNQGRHPIDYNQATWYDDCGNGPRHHEW